MQPTPNHINQDKCQGILDNINEYLYTVEYREDRVTSLYQSPQCLKITGYSAEEFYQDDLLWFKIIHKDDSEMIREVWRDICSDKVRMPIQHRIIRKDGTERWVINNCAGQLDPSGKILRLDGSVIDVSDLNNEAVNNAFIAHYDLLTKLPNRNMLYNWLDKSVRLARRENKHLAVLFLDLDNFKIINDSMGHDAGDRVLVGMARQLNGFIRAGDTLARWGGDEFILALWDCGVDGAAFVANKLTCTGFKVEGIDMVVSMSAGISVYPEDGDDYQTLLKNADIAMYHAKRSGRQNYEFFAPAMNVRVKERFILANEMRRALDMNEFVLFYQPRINIGTGEISGVEALLRWRHPTRGLLLPDDFLPVAEESGLTRRINEWVLLNACRQIKVWQNQIPKLPVSVNIAPAYFRVKEFEEVIRATLWETQIDSECLELELTENTIVADPDHTFLKLAGLKAMGVQLILDNFGTGYSSLQFLKKLSVDKMKIHGSFVKEMLESQDAVDLVRAIISIGHNMKAAVVAGGIENGSQLAFLRNEGCDEGQGFYFCRPVPAEDMAALISGSLVFQGMGNYSLALRVDKVGAQTGK